MALSEDQVLAILERELPKAYRALGAKRLERGMGDDCALLSQGAETVAWTIDSCEENSHFVWEWMRAEDVAHKAFHAAVSDVPAMGATPRAALCHLTVGPRVTVAWLRQFARRQAECAKATRTPIVGGNISFGSSTQVVTTVFGELNGGPALLRSGARAGDEVWLVGEVGLARAGLLWLKQTPTRARGRGPEKACLRAFRNPMALIDEGNRLSSCAHSCMDVSDGLARDCGKLGEASRVRIVLDEEMLRDVMRPELLALAKKWGADPFAWTLQGGEDYALLATGPGAKRPQFVRVVGHVERATKRHPKGAVLRGRAGDQHLSGGFVHGRPSP